ncbi:MAG: hypothetical protein B7Z69_07585 [Actinobacteria bacterium 21-73-9]|nr:MAG: hypothetical protein B7Z69_07585 [Actinobacteria bacterium 21-73-9]
MRWGRARLLTAALALGALVGVPAAWAAPAGASAPTLTPVVTYVNPAAEIGVLANDGAHLWGEGSGGCAPSNVDNSLVEFTESGSFVAAYPLAAGPGTCDGYLPVAANGSYVVTVSDGTVYVLDVATATLTPYNLTSTFTHSDLKTRYSVALSSTTAYVSSESDNAIVALDLATGTHTTWSTNPNNSANDSPVALEMVGGALVSLEWQDNNHYYEWQRVDTTTGAFSGLSVTPIMSSATVPTVSVGGGALYVTAGATEYEYSLTTLALVTSATIPAATLFASLEANGSLWVSAAFQGEIYQLDPTTLAVESAYRVGSYAPAWLSASGSSLFADDGNTGDVVQLLGSAATTRVPTTTALAVASASAVYGAPDALTATVSTPGTVTFYADGQAIAGCASVAATTTATCAWSPSAVGAVTLTASLVPGDATDAVSTSPPVTVSVQPAASTVQVTVKGPGVAAVTGGRLTATASVSTPGTVTFSANGVTIPGCLGVPATATTATCAFRVGAVGSWRVVASLAPSSADYAPSSQGVTLRVVAARGATRVGPFVVGGAELTPALERQVSGVAATVARDGYTVVWVIGHERPTPADAGQALARARAVAALLHRDLAAHGAGAVRVVLGVGARGFPSATVTMGF